MLETKSKTVEEQYTIYKRRYAKQQFYGPYLDFVEIESKGGISIELGRSYSEDSKYADTTRMELAVKLLYEVAKEKKKPIYLKIWGTQLEILHTQDEAAIYNELSSFILKNVTF